MLTLTSAQDAASQTGTLTISYNPLSATVLIDSKLYKGINGVVSVKLPVGSHDYIVAADDYETQEGSVKVRANQTVYLPLTLSRVSNTQVPASRSAQTDPLGSSSGLGRVARCGSWSFNADCCSVPFRSWYYPSSTHYYLGLRLAF